MRRPRPRWAAGCVVIAALTPAVLAGCGSSGDFAAKIGGEESTASSEPAQAGTAAPAHGPKEIAESVNLRAEDFPYLKEGDGRADSSEDPRAQREFAECVGAAQLGGELASAKSPDFNGLLGGEYVEFSSEAEVFATEAAAERVAGLLHGHRVYSCFTRLLQPVLEREETGTDVELISVRTEPLPFPDKGIPGGFGLRVVARVAAAPESRQLTAFAPGRVADGERTLNVYMDILIFVSGRVEADLTADGSPSPVPASLERNLLRLLQTRAEEASGRLR